MEFVAYSLVVVSVAIILAKPKWEKWAFRALVVSFVIAALVYLTGVSGSLIPAVNL